MSYIDYMADDASYYAAIYEAVGADTSYVAVLAVYAAVAGVEFAAAAVYAAAAAGYAAQEGR